MIRPAVPADVPRLVEMGSHFLRSTRYAGTISEQPAQMAATVEQMIAADHTTVLVHERDGVVVGMIGMLVFTHPLSGERFASEVFWWMEPAHRGSAGIRLLLAAEAWATAQGAAKVQMIAPTEAVGTMYQRLGYEPVETHYQRVLC